MPIDNLTIYSCYACCLQLFPVALYLKPGKRQPGKFPALKLGSLALTLGDRERGSAGQHSFSLYENRIFTREQKKKYLQEMFLFLGRKIVSEGKVIDYSPPMRKLHS